MKYIGWPNLSFPALRVQLPRPKKL
ncbi:Protein of unknown function [Pyronema omphalodes CBS 100304]|uniref:Uncharacterized protein n=1 Tax=Pyronema omphalodes (strain CBS 100304) TaxID=1076935 RepID=U4LGD7_PYROM|nr:Protein of unknown function [Pyronema omphalodes CBS 100304]